MPEFYLIAVILLFTLAVSDLIVGVSNDAVNFLNSAIGSKVAPRHIIMIVASLGIFVGATFSSGMMEVARKGIFNPEYFYFSEIMVIFLAVMLTDIILLDLFNTFGMPTSTTVSIVFELLGSAVVVSLIKMSAAGEGASALGNYINSSSALAIISGIFLSVGVAFLVGTLLQYLSRLLFTFRYEKRLKWVGTLWSGLALAALTYFLLIKGIKGASFVSGDFIKWVGKNTLLLIGVSFVFWSVVMQLLHSVFKVNILRIVVLFGTFALAMAFAGNDLVNFIGVPIAGFESYNAWAASGVDAEAYDMAVLKQPVRTKTYLLLAAGLIMIVTLWLSKKARSVTETEVNLGRQDEGAERFSPNQLAKGIVRYTIGLGRGLQGVIPKSWLEKSGNSFEPVEEESPETNDKEYDRPAFDLVRASVNLTVASMLISLATSLKLPLSTTYVSFMVAMGTSLADRAWGRDSAVYRVAGVLNVIGGWFGTAFIAFTVSGIFAFLMYFYGGWAMGALVILAATLITRTFLLHRSKEKAKATLKAFDRQRSEIPAPQLIDDTARRVGKTIESISRTYTNAVSGLLNEDLRTIQAAKENLKELNAQNEELKYKLFGSIKRIRETHNEGSRLYLLLYDLEQDILQSTTLIVKACEEHVANSLNPLRPDQVKLLKKVRKNVSQYLDRIAEMMKQKNFEEKAAILKEKDLLFHHIEEGLNAQVKGVKAAEYGMRNSLLVFTLKLETKDLIAVAARFIKLYHRVSQIPPKGGLSLVTGNEKE
jgi:hypothetical protein